MAKLDQEVPQAGDLPFRSGGAEKPRTPPDRSTAGERPDTPLRVYQVIQRKLSHVIVVDESFEASLGRRSSVRSRASSGGRGGAARGAPGAERKLG